MIAAACKVTYSRRGRRKEMRESRTEEKEKYRDDTAHLVQVNHFVDDDDGNKKG